MISQNLFKKFNSLTNMANAPNTLNTSNTPNTTNTDNNWKINSNTQKQLDYYNSNILNNNNIEHFEDEDKTQKAKYSEQEVEDMIANNINDWNNYTGQILVEINKLKWHKINKNITINKLTGPNQNDEARKIAAEKIFDGIKQETIFIQKIFLYKLREKYLKHISDINAANNVLKKFKSKSILTDGTQNTLQQTTQNNDNIIKDIKDIDVGVMGAILNWVAGNIDNDLIEDNELENIHTTLVKIYDNLYEADTTGNLLRLFVIKNKKNRIDPETNKIFFTKESISNKESVFISGIDNLFFLEYGQVMEIWERIEQHAKEEKRKAHLLDAGPEPTLAPTTTYAPTTTEPEPTFSELDWESGKSADVVETVDKSQTLIIVDSRYRENYHTTQSSKYLFKLPKEFKRVKELKLEQCYIKNNSYNINSNNNHLKINIQVTDVKRNMDIIQNILIPKGNYFQNQDNSQYNLDKKLNSLFQLYSEFKNITIDFNYNNNKYYIYQSYAHLLKENSNIYNIFLNFGRLEKIIDTNSNNTITINTDSATATDTSIFKAPGWDNNLNSDKQDIFKNGPVKQPLKETNRDYIKKTIGSYMGYYPNTYSTHISQFINIKYYYDTTIVDNTNTPYNILRFEFNNSETLFNKVYDILTWSKEDMFIGFLLKTPINNSKHGVLKLEPGFANNIITHHSDGFIPTGAPFRQFPELAGESTFIEIYIKKKLHEFPKHNIIIEPENATNILPTIFSNLIILPIISDKPYELNNDDYMLMHLTAGNRKLDRINSSSNAILEMENAFTQFRSEQNNQYFINTFNNITYKFGPAGVNINNLFIEFYDKYGNEFDFNNIDHSFVLKLIHVLPQIAG